MDPFIVLIIGFIILFVSILIEVPNLHYIALRFLHYRLHHVKRKNVTVKNMKIAFLHTFCNIGTDAENVLWNAVQALRIQYPEAEIYIYTERVNACPTDILRKVKENLNIYIEENIKFLHLKRRNSYPCLHSWTLDTISLGLEALDCLVPDVFVDITGISCFAFVLKYFGKVKTISYVQCPTAVRDIPENTLGDFVTTECYKFYDLILANSTFAKKHISDLITKSIHLVYPPCQVNSLKNMFKKTHKTKKPENIRVISLIQYRPNQDNQFQLHVLNKLKEIIDEELFQRITLVLCGTCRSVDDEEVVEDLMKLGRKLGLENNIKLIINPCYGWLLQEFRQAYIGIQINCKHFGINVVEEMATGLIVVANKYEEVCLDIIDTAEDSRTGYLAATTEEFARSLKTILEASDEQNNEIRKRAIASLDKFSIKTFHRELSEAVNSLFL